MKNQSHIDDKTLLSLLDVSGSCIVDIVYNHLYDRAISVHEKTNVSLTDCYRRALLDYLDERKSPRFFTVLLNSLHHYTRMSTIYNDITYQDCVNLYSSLFIPQMYIPSLTFDQKLNLLTMIFAETINKFVEKINEQHISCIIDDHNDPINVEILQDCILKILLSQRSSTYDKFIESQKKPAEETKKNIEKPQALVKIADAYKKALSERMTLKKKNTQLLKKNKNLIKQFDDLKKLFLSQIAVQKDQSNIINELKTKLERLSSMPNLSHDLVSDMKVESSIETSQSTFETTYEDEDLFNVRFAE